MILAIDSDLKWFGVNSQKFRNSIPKLKSWDPKSCQSLHEERRGFKWFNVDESDVDIALIMNSTMNSLCTFINPDNNKKYIYEFIMYPQPLLKWHRPRWFWIRCPHTLIANRSVHFHSPLFSFRHQIAVCFRRSSNPWPSLRFPAAMSAATLPPTGGRELSNPPSDGISNLRFSNHSDLLLVSSWDRVCR